MFHAYAVQRRVENRRSGATGFVGGCGGGGGGGPPHVLVGVDENGQAEGRTLADDGHEVVEELFVVLPRARVLHSLLARGGAEGITEEAEGRMVHRDVEEGKGFEHGKSA